MPQITREATPLGYALNFSNDANFNFATQSPFTNMVGNASGMVSNEFLLLEGAPFLLLNGTNFLLL